MRTREDIEEREGGWLAPYGMRAAASRGRRREEPRDPWRTEFQRDRDRILHSAAFRRLDSKTQVFVSRTGDHYRTRLTHSLEVAQITRSVARTLGLNEDLAEAVALAHDLGHTPFGHSGGDVLARLMRDHGGFDHNLQSYRIVDVLEDRYPEFPGLNLTYEVRESILKHNRPYHGPQFAEHHPEEGPLLEAQLVDVCDGIAYNSHDLDDGLYSGILGDEIWDLEILRVVADEVEARWPGIEGVMRRKKAISQIIDYLLRDLVRETEGRLAAAGVRTVDDVRAQAEPLVGLSHDVARQEQELRDFLYENFYTHYRVHGMRNRAKVFIESLFGEFVANPKLMPPKFRDRAAADGIHRAVADYIAGMTDAYAESEYRRLFHPFERR